MFRDSQANDASNNNNNNNNNIDIDISVLPRAIAAASKSDRPLCCGCLTKRRQPPRLAQCKGLDQVVASLI